jgi:uncharacterized protein YndB with AHSA1/START domain
MVPTPSLLQPSRGVLLIADITGYTMYLRESELAHAHGVLSDLITVLVAGTRPPLTVSNLQGDAVFSYGIETTVGGQTFVEIVESIYVAFRKAIDEMAMNTTCGCNACANLGTLDLKFVIHHGEFLIQNIGDKQELLGSDVILAHRLAKNTVTASTGIRAYALYTKATVDALDIGHLASDWVAHREEYDAGAVDCWVADMTPVWAAARGRSAIEITEEEYLGGGSVELAVPVEVVWDHLTNPEFRRILVGSERQELEAAVRRRMGEGDVYQCYHGDQVVPSVVLEWQPFARMVTRDLIHVPGARVDLTVDYRLTATDGGTALGMAAARPEGSEEALASFAAVWPAMSEAVVGALGVFKELVEADVKALSP